MSKPMRCATCGDMVGTYVRPFFYKLKWYGKCPGKGNHPKPVRTEKFKWFKRYREVWLEYPDSGCVSHWIERRQPDGSYKFLRSIAPK